MERYPVLDGPEVSQKQALDLAKALDLLPAGEEMWPNARRNPVGPLPQKMQKITDLSFIFNSLWDARTMDLLHLLGGVMTGPRPILVLLGAENETCKISDMIHKPLIIIDL
jgi:hypothetical protein